MLDRQAYALAGFARPVARERQKFRKICRPGWNGHTPGVF